MNTYKKVIMLNYFARFNAILQKVFGEEHNQTLTIIGVFSMAYYLGWNIPNIITILTVFYTTRWWFKPTLTEEEAKDKPQKSHLTAKQIQTVLIPAKHNEQYEKSLRQKEHVEVTNMLLQLNMSDDPQMHELNTLLAEKTIGISQFLPLVLSRRFADIVRDNDPWLALSTLGLGFSMLWPQTPQANLQSRALLLGGCVLESFRIVATRGPDLEMNDNTPLVVRRLMKSIEPKEPVASSAGTD